jgi:hypothetical protein
MARKCTHVLEQRFRARSFDLINLSINYLSFLAELARIPAIPQIGDVIVDLPSALIASLGLVLDDELPIEVVDGVIVLK